MKLIIPALIAIFLPLSAVAAQEFFIPSDVVQSWGYTIVTKNNTQYIKSIKKVPESNPEYYPRFYLGKKCYANDLEAKKVDDNKKEDIKNSLGGFKIYRDSFIHNKCLYSLSTDSNYFRLEFQPEVLKKYRGYITRFAQSPE